MSMITLTPGLGSLGAGCPQYLDHVLVPCPTQPPRVSTIAAPSTPDPRLACEALFRVWAKGRPALMASGCMDSGDRKDIVNACIGWQMGTTTLAEAQARQQQIVKAACGSSWEANCQNSYDTWAAATPDTAACVTSEGRRRIVDICITAKREEWDLKKYFEHFNAALATYAVCPSPPPVVREVPAPPAVPPSPIQSAPPPSPPPIKEYVESVVTGDPIIPTTATYAPQPFVPTQQPMVTPMDTQERSAFRKWGPVIGVLLLVGAGVYVVR